MNPLVITIIPESSIGNSAKFTPKPRPSSPSRPLIKPLQPTHHYRIPLNNHSPNKKNRRICFSLSLAGKASREKGSREFGSSDRLYTRKTRGLKRGCRRRGREKTKKKPSGRPSPSALLHARELAIMPLLSRE